VVTEARMLTHDTREIHLRLAEPAEIEFRPGQYVQVQVPGHSPPVYRAYSVSSPPHEKSKIQLVVRLIPGGLGSTYLHNVQVDDTVTFTGAYGEFILDEGMDTEIICVGGGCGMAPMKSIIHYLYNRSPQRKCTLYFGARTSADLLYYEEFEQLAKQYGGFQIHFALSEPGEEDADWDGETGFIHLSVEKHCPDAGPRQAFLCGPEPMIDATMEVLRAKTVPEDQIFYDKF
jgi:Na+-transporting NADH:ubiquinone oxidoreductase subunit F